MIYYRPQFLVVLLTTHTISVVFHFRVLVLGKFATQREKEREMASAAGGSVRRITSVVISVIFVAHEKKKSEDGYLDLHENEKHTHFILTELCM